MLDAVAGEVSKRTWCPAIARVWKTEIEDLRTDLRGWLQHIAVNDDDWEPIHFEFAFGLAARCAAAIRRARLEVARPGECGVRLRGSIDLVERHITRGVLRVTDHKTGKLPETIPAYRRRRAIPATAAVRARRGKAAGRDGRIADGCFTRRNRAGISPSKFR